MTTVSDLIRSKSAVWSIRPDAPVYEALEILAQKDVGALLVMSDGRLDGILSERDYARKVALQGKSSHDLPVRDIMTSDVVTVRPDQSVDECMALMTDRHVRHLPVLENDGIVGIVSIGDVVKSIMSHQEQLIQQLEGYISGW